MKLMSMLVSTAVLSGSMLFATTASANTDQLAVSICEYIAADDKTRLRKTLKDARLKIRDINDSVQCNGNNLLCHALVSGANDAGEFIIKSLPKSSLEDGADLAWANENGFGGSPLIAVIKERAGL